MSKFIAGREKDLEFAGALLGAQLVDVAELRQRADELWAAGTLEPIAQRRAGQGRERWVSRVRRLVWLLASWNATTAGQSVPERGGQKKTSLIASDRPRGMMIGDLTVTEEVPR